VQVDGPKAADHNQYQQFIRASRGKEAGLKSWCRRFNPVPAHHLILVSPRTCPLASFRNIPLEPSTWLELALFHARELPALQLEALRLKGWAPLRDDQRIASLWPADEKRDALTH
jgi:hypothetical protein